MKVAKNTKKSSKEKKDVELEGVEVLGPPESEIEEFSPDVFEVIDDLEIVGNSEFLEDAKLAIPSTTTKDLVPYSPFNAYLAEIRRFKPLSKVEEHKLAIRYKTTGDKDAAYRLVSSNLWLVVKIAREYERIARNALDLIQEGNIGLMEAIKNFDPYRGVRFPSYAVWWIKAYIIRYMIANWRMVKIGTTQAQRKLFFNLKKESERLEREGITPTTKLIAQNLNVKEDDVIEMAQRLGSSDMSVDAPLSEDSDNNNLLSILPSQESSAEENLANQQISKLLRDSLDDFAVSLTEKERVILDGRIVSEDKLTLQELSEQLEISKERVRQIENKIRDKLKVFITERAKGELDEWLPS